MENIHKAYEATINEVIDSRKVKYEIIAKADVWYVLYFGYVIRQVENKATPEENLKAAQEFLFSQRDRTFTEIPI